MRSASPFDGSDAGRVRRRRRSRPRHVVHWVPADWARHESEAYDARCQRRAAHRRSLAGAGLLIAGLSLASAVTGSGLPIALLAILMAMGAVLIARDGVSNWLGGR